jgi:hypothetical protein
MQLVDLATGRKGPGSLEAHRSFLEHVLLLRELAHHGRVSRVHLNQFEPPTPPHIACVEKQVTNIGLNI